MLQILMLVMQSVYQKINLEEKHYSSFEEGLKEMLYDLVDLLHFSFHVVWFIIISSSYEFFIRRLVYWKAAVFSRVGKSEVSLYKYYMMLRVLSLKREALE